MGQGGPYNSWGDCQYPSPYTRLMSVPELPRLLTAFCTPAAEPCQSSWTHVSMPLLAKAALRNIV